jgi:hypothetical protein
MHISYNRRTATKVQNGRVQRKNRHRPTGRQGYVIDRESPGRGFRHVLSKRDLQAFIDLIPDWDRLSQCLERIVLGRANSCDGEYVFYHREETSSIFLNAWQEDLWMEIAVEYFDSHKEIFQTLGVSHDKPAKSVLCRFTEPQVRAFMLLHVFMHELGHHHDRLQQKHNDAKRGEEYAERFANSRFNQMLPDYIRVFGDPSKQNQL